MQVIAFSKWIQDKPLPEMAKALKVAGFDGVEMPVRPGAPINHENASQLLPEAKRILNDNGLSLERVVTGITGPAPGLDELLTLFTGLGIRNIRLDTGPFPRGGNFRQSIAATRADLAGLEPYLKRHGIKAQLQNHSGRSAASNVGIILYYLEGRDPKYLGAQLDPGHLAVSGELIDVAIGLLGPYLHTVNAKSPRQEPVLNPNTGKLSWKTTWVPLWDGMVDWEEVLQELKKAGYNDSVSVHAEYRSPYYIAEHDVDYSTQAIAADCAFLKQLLKGMAPTVDS